MASINIAKIYVEQNKGFFKEIDNPHIQSSLEIPARFEENDDLFLNIEGLLVERQIFNNNQRILKNLTTNNLQQIQQQERKILETKHVVIPLIINDETNEQQISQLTNYVSVFKNKIGTNEEYVLEYQAEMVENLNSSTPVDVTKKKYKAIIKLPREPRNLYLLHGSYSIVQTQTSIGLVEEIVYDSISYDTIFERGELKTEIDVYQLQTGEIWYGSIITTDKNLIFTNEQNPRQLQRKKTLNTRLIDLRVISKIEKKKKNFKEQNEILLNNRIRQVEKRGKNFYFSDIYINQKNKVTSCSFFFNDNNFILENCLFSRIYETIPESLKNLILLNSRIIDFKVYRRRVQKTGKSKNKLSDTSESYGLFQGEKEELVAQTKQEIQNQTITPTENLQEFYSLDFDMNQRSRFFKFQDNFLLDKNEGLYQYKVEIEMDDYSIEIVKNDVKELQKLLKVLKVYSEAQTVLMAQPNAKGVRKLQNREADRYLNTYFDILNRYFINDDLYNQNEVFKIKQSLKSQIVGNSNTPSGILNFIKLLNNLISDLVQFVSLEIFSFDDPHIDLELNNIEKNSKRTMMIQNYFSNDVADASIAKIKNVNFFPSNSSINYDEFNFQEFSNFLIQLNNAQRIKEDRILPFSVTEGGIGYSLTSQTQQFIDTEQSTKNKRQNILNHNLNVSVIQNLNNNMEEVENEENYLYRQDINNFFDYISSNLVQNKTIDEASAIFSNSNDILLSQFEGEIQILSFTSTKTGTWTNLREVGTLPSEYGNYLFCRIMPAMGDSNNKIWESLKDITCTDTYFYIKINSKEEAARLVQVMNSSMTNLNLSLPAGDPGTQAISRNNTFTISSRKVENLFFS